MSKYARDGSVPIGATDWIPFDPGLYVVYSDTEVTGITWSPVSGALYVGKADDGLRRRIGKEHGGDTGRSTLRRSLAALLKDDLQLTARCRPTRGKPKPTDFTNFSLEPDGDHRLSDWMATHLTVAVVAQAVVAGEEKTLIAEFEPPLNLRGWDNPWRQVVGAARAKCAAEARSHHHG